MCFNVFYCYFVVVDYDDDGDDKVHTATALDCFLCHSLCYCLPFCEAAFC